MSLFTRIFGRKEAAAPVIKREDPNSGQQQPPTPRQGGVLWPMYSGSTALCVATVFRCVKLLSESVANLAVQTMRLKDGVYVDDRSSRLSYLLNVQPDPNTSAFDFWCRLIQCIARKCMRIVKENIIFALGIKVLCLVLGAFGIANMLMAIFADVGVMVLAVLNAIRALSVDSV